MRALELFLTLQIGLVNWQTGSNDLLHIQLESKIFNPLDLQDILLPRTAFHENSLTMASVNYYTEYISKHMSDPENVKLI